MAEKKKKGFFAKLKDSLKINRGPKGANLELKRKRGRTPKSETKMASFREDTKANKKLQEEAKDPTKSYTTYTKVSSKNKAQLSDQHKVKPKETKKNLQQKIDQEEKLQQDLLEENKVNFIALELPKVKKH